MLSRVRLGDEPQPRDQGLYPYPPDFRRLQPEPLLTGSAAQGADHPLSDRDIQVFTTDIAALLEDESWWERLGEVLVVERLEDGDGNPTRLVYYAGGKLDFTLLPADDLGGRFYGRPFRVLLDKDSIAGTASHRPLVASAPKAGEFWESVNWAWAAALMEAKAIVRDEPWSAKLRTRTSRPNCCA
ncbi:aminoglycoside 6-adenylyltransferase [Nocardia paucivorans]|uniref:aminoglycoside 6-adenylyltransferase n=1 Tax=Nocardia paucivorans TaxID=114259 RepID=UPI0002D9E667|nr:aminoglycoside 6-adenylyltransferase [Nocardia paucivorans]